MSRESDFIAHMRTLATRAGARGLMDDAAVLARPDGAVVLTHDMLVEGVHFLPDDPPGDVAWKLVAVNISDLSAKGATPIGVLIGYGMSGDAAWDAAFAQGLGHALTHFNAPLLGGDTVTMPAGGPRTLGLTALGAAPTAGAPDRRGARAGDLLFVSGSIGDAGAGLALLRGQEDAPQDVRAPLINAYRRPMPQQVLGPDIAPFVSAMADISDGALIDADRIARASGVSITLDIARLPLSSAYITLRGDDVQSRLAAATAGDDYQLLFTAPPEHKAALYAAAAHQEATVHVIGACAAGKPGLITLCDGAPCPLPERLGYEHDR